MFLFCVYGGGEICYEKQSVPKHQAESVYMCASVLFIMTQ